MHGNLEWCSNKYNNNYGTRLKRVGESLKASEKFKNARQAISIKRSKPVKCIELNKVFYGMSEASRQTKTHQGDIWKCCNNKRKTANGYHWQYAEGGV